ncbi:hypothetical protein U1Q18_004939 [Sarracenia purpurea var. burkii]
MGHYILAGDIEEACDDNCMSYFQPLNMVRIGLKGASSSTGASKHSSMPSQPSQPSIPSKQKRSLKAVKGEEAHEVPKAGLLFSGMALVAARPLLLTTEAPFGNAFLFLLVLYHDCVWRGKTSLILSFALTTMLSLLTLSICGR